VCSTKGAPVLRFPETRTGTDSKILWLRRWLAVWLGRMLGVLMGFDPFFYGVGMHEGNH
jgi:hypothetical protein